MGGVSVFSGERVVGSPQVVLSGGLALNRRLRMDGLDLLGLVGSGVIPVAFFDPQYRGVLDRMGYGNEGKKRGQRRCALEQMSEEVIGGFVREIGRVLIGSGHLFLWMDKFHLCEGFGGWLEGSGLEVVDLVSWDKGRMGMGYRCRRVTEYCVVLQKAPRRAKGVWRVHNIPDTWRESSNNGRGHPHKKPVDLQGALIEAVSDEEDVVLDPAAGDFTVMEAARRCGRNFLGCDLNG